MGLSLKWKITIIGFIPLACFMVLAFNQVNQSYEGYLQAQIVKKDLGMINVVTKIVHETQKERGLSGAFLAGGIDQFTLSEQRKLNDIVLNKLKPAIETSSFNSDYKDDVLRQYSNIKEIRKSIDAKQVSTQIALKSYSAIIERLLQIELEVAKNTSFAEVAGGLRTLAIIEDAKESAGRLRAQMTSILTTNEAISESTFDNVVGLKSGVDANVASRGLVLDRITNESLDSFKNSSEWKIVSDTFRHVLSNSKIGNYGQSATDFFNHITTAINILGDAVTAKTDTLIETADKLAEKSLSTLWTYLATLIFVAIFLAFVVYKITRSVTMAFSKIAKDILEESKKVSESSSEMSINSSELSEASLEQASSLQETVSSIDEISSMVQRNAEAANNASNVSKNSTEAALRGKRTVEQMIDSIRDIAQSNDEISKIVKVITEIGEKTKVINDIVFQTKLLSFNASVEAARAGEHGKGFAVVAEEVGSLAAMSGKAAHEIGDMIEGSIQQVTDVVEKTKIKVTAGAKTAEECGQALDEIKNNVSSVNEMINEIAVASTEQAAGVREVTVAMQQLDQTTHQNTTVAQKTSTMANSLRKQSGRLNDNAIELIKIITGKTVVETKSVKADSVDKNVDSDLKNLVESNIANRKASGVNAMPSFDDSRFEDV